MRVGVARDAALVAQGLGDRLAERDADVLDRVVVVDVQVALGPDREVEEAVAGHLVEHMVEEAHARADVAQARAVEVDRDLHGRFRRLTPDAGAAQGHSFFARARAS